MSRDAARRTAGATSISRGGIYRVLLVTIAAGWLCSQPAPREQVGKLADGSFLLPTGWRIKPLGKQIPVDTLPMSSAMSILS